MSQLFNLDNEMPETFSMIHKIDHSTTDGGLSGTLLLVGYEASKFQEFVRINHSHRLLAPGGVVFAYWGVFVRERSEDEFYNAMDLGHQGFGTQTLGLASLTMTGALGKVATTLGTSAGGIGAWIPGDATKLADNLNIIRERAIAVHQGPVDTGPTPYEALHPVPQKGDITKKLLYIPLEKLFNVADRYYLAFSPRGPDHKHAPGVRGEKSRRLLAAKSELSIGQACSTEFA